MPESINSLLIRIASMIENSHVLMAINSNIELVDSISRDGPDMYCVEVYVCLVIFVNYSVNIV